MAELVPFIYSDLRIRVVVVDDEPWFVLGDLCKILEIGNPSDVRKRLDPNDTNTLDCVEGIQRTRGNPRSVIVNESGMYDVVLRSDKPEAAKFRRWITSEVLPTIRKTGGAYIEPGSQAELDFSNPDTMLDAFQRALDIAKEMRAKLEVEQAAHKETKEYATLLEPPAEAWLNLADAEGTYSVADAAKQLSRDSRIRIGRDRLFAYMAEIGWIFRDRKTRRWKACQEHIENGDLAMPAVKEFFHKKLEIWMVPEPSVRVTPKGMRRLHTRLVASATLESPQLV